MDEVAAEIDKIVSSLVSEAEAHAFAEQATQSVSSTQLQDRAGSTWNRARDVEAQANTEPAAPSGSGVQHSVDDGLQQLLSTSSSQQSDASAHNKDFTPQQQLSSSAAAQQQAPDLQQSDITSAEGLTDRTDVPESVAKNSRLAALKQRRLGSLSSSLDLSRESSFESAQHPACNEDANPLQNSLAGKMARDSSSAMQAEAGVNEQASVSLAPLPLSSTTGTPQRWGHLTCTIKATVHYKPVSCNVPIGKLLLQSCAAAKHKIHAVQSKHLVMQCKPGRLV